MCIRLSSVSRVCLFVTMIFLLSPVSEGLLPSSSSSSFFSFVSSSEKESYLYSAIPGVIVYSGLTVVILVTYLNKFCLPNSDSSVEQKKIESALSSNLDLNRSQRKKELRNMLTTDEKALYRAESCFFYSAFLFVALRLSYHLSLFGDVDNNVDRYLIILRRLSMVVNFTMLSFVIYWWVVCYSTSFRLNFRHTLKRVLVVVNILGYLITFLFMFLWWGLYTDPTDPSYLTNFCHEGSVWIMFALSILTAGSMSVFVVVLYIRQRNEVWFLRGQKMDLVFTIVISILFFLVYTLSGTSFLVIFFLRKDNIHVADWLLFLVEYYIPEIIYFPVSYCTLS